MPDKPPIDFLTEKEASAVLRISGKSLQKHRMLGSGPSFYKLGGKVLYKLADLVHWTEQNKHQSTTGYITE